MLRDLANLHVVHFESGPQTKLGTSHHRLSGAAEKQEVREEEEIALLMVACPCRDLHHPTLFQHLPGWGHQIDPTSYRLLHLEKLLELVDPLHGVVGMGRSLGHLDEGACKGEYLA